MLTVDNPNKFHWDNISLDDCIKGNALDVYYTLKLFHLLYEKVQKLPCFTLLKEVISPAIVKIGKLEYGGCLVSPEELSNLELSLNRKLADLEDEIFNKKYVQKTDNLNSPKDVCDILYLREDGLRLYPPDKTKTGQPSTDAKTLKLLLDQINKELVTRGKMG